MAVEYLASNEFVANGVQTDWTVSFKGNRPDASGGTVPYLNASDVKAQEIVPATLLNPEVVIDRTCTLVSPNVFRVTPAVASGRVVRIYRATQDEYNLVDYKSRQTVTEADLDLSNRQNIFIVQETSDLANRAAVDATEAVQLAFDAINEAADATDLSESAIAIANTAQNTASNSIAAAAAAQSAANAATAAAAAANGIAAGAVDTAEDALDVAEAQASLVAGAITTANNADATAQGALAVANAIAGTANSALANSVTALDRANDAYDIADNIATTAELALTRADAAVVTADEAQTTAEGIAGTAGAAYAVAFDAATLADSANEASNAAVAAVAALTTSAVPEGSRLYYTDARVRAAPLTGLSYTAGPIVAGDSVLAALGRAQYQLSDRYTIAQSLALVGNRGGVGRNLLHNSSFRIQQRNVTSVNVAAGNNAYWIDRWQALGACVASVAQYPAITNPGGGSWAMTITSGAVQQLCLPEEFEVGTYTLSWAGNAPCYVYGYNTATLLASGTSPLTFTFNPLNDGYLVVRFTTGQVTRPQLERGTVATAYEPTSYTQELLQCQRVFARKYGLGMNAPYCSSAGQAMSQRLNWPVQMRALPTITYILPNIGTYLVQSYAFDSPSVTGFRMIMFSSSAGNGFSIDFPAGGSMTDYVQGSCEPT
jgi:hypothetical protein